MRNIILTASLMAICLSGCVPKGPIRYPAARWVKDNDRISIEMPEVDQKAIEIEAVDSYMYRQLEQVMAVTSTVQANLMAMATGGRQEALNVNNFDETADSTWFTNRLGRRMVSAKEVVREAYEGGSPVKIGPLRIIAAKTQGKVPRLLVLDSKGHRYLMRFEPPGLRGIALGAETVSAMILATAGYNVPHNDIVEIDTGKLMLGKGAQTRGKYGDVRDMTEKDLRLIIEKVTGGRGGRVRAVAGRFFRGNYIGPFSYSGRRYADENDRIPHQHRRELRGYKMFAALLNMMSPTDARTADIFLPVEGKKGYIEHCIFDFGSAFGGAGSWDKIPDPQEFKGDDYLEAVASAFTLGLRQTGDEYEDEFGFLDAGRFEPGSWNPSVSNDAFTYMTRRDAFWAARIIMRLTDEIIDAIVERAGFEDERIRRYVARSLKARRDKIGAYGFSVVNPLDDFAVRNKGDSVNISFSDLAVDYGFEGADETEYRYMVLTQLGQVELSPWKYFTRTDFLLDRELMEKLDPRRVYMVKVQTKRAGKVWYTSSVDLYVRRVGNGMKLLGLHRRYGRH